MGHSFDAYRPTRLLTIGYKDCQLLLPKNALGSSFLKRGLLQRHHRSVRYFLLRNLRFLAELGRREALPADVVLHIIAPAIRWRRQKADLRYDDLRAITALAGLPVVPGARPQRAFDIQTRPLANVVAQDLGRSLKADQVMPLSVLLPVTVDVAVTLAGGERQIDDRAGAQDVDRRVLAGPAREIGSVSARRKYRER